LQSERRDEHKKKRPILWGLLGDTPREENPPLSEIPHFVESFKLIPELPEGWDVEAVSKIFKSNLPVGWDENFLEIAELRGKKPKQIVVERIIPEEKKKKIKQITLTLKPRSLKEIAEQFVDKRTVQTFEQANQIIKQWESEEPEIYETEREALYEEKGEQSFFVGRGQTKLEKGIESILIDVKLEGYDRSDFVFTYKLSYKNVGKQNQPLDVYIRTKYPEFAKKYATEDTEESLMNVLRKEGYFDTPTETYQKLFKKIKREDDFAQYSGGLEKIEDKILAATKFLEYENLISSAGRNKKTLESYLETFPSIADRIATAEVLLSKVMEAGYSVSRLELTIAEGKNTDLGRSDCESDKEDGVHRIGSRRNVTPQECSLFMWMIDKRLSLSSDSDKIVKEVDLEKVKGDRERFYTDMKEMRENNDYFVKNKHRILFLELIARMVDEGRALPFTGKALSPYDFYSSKFAIQDTFWASSVDWDRIIKSIAPPIMATYNPISTITTRAGKTKLRGIVGYITEEGVAIPPGQRTGLLPVLYYNYIAGFWADQYSPQKILEADRKRIKAATPEVKRMISQYYGREPISASPRRLNEEDSDE